MFQFININQLSTLVFKLSNEELGLLIRKTICLIQKENSKQSISDIKANLEELQEKYKIYVFSTDKDKNMEKNASLLITADVMLFIEVVEEIRNERNKNNGPRV